mmetsp:Transcript_13798/g.44257  ORF Transcript_13798/g.44257 Transcript_13798/m.44257 type:complete len:319 (-) Transcript_13798:93-1049(-)
MEMPRVSSSAPRLTLAQSIVAAEKGDLVAWKTILKYDTSFLDDTNGYSETFLEFYLTHCVSYFESREEFYIAVEEIVRLNKESRRSPVVGNVNFDDLLEELVDEDCVPIIKYVVRHYLSPENSSTIASALLNAIERASEDEKGDLFAALPSEAEFDATELFTKIVKNGGVKYLGDVVSKIGANFQKHEVLVALGSALGVATETDRDPIISLISSVSADGFDFRAEPKRKTPSSPPPPPKKSSSVARPSAARPSAAASTTPSATATPFAAADSEDDEDKKKKRPLVPDGKGGFKRPSGRAPTRADGVEKKWDSKRGKWF